MQARSAPRFSPERAVAAPLLFPIRAAHLLWNRSVLEKLITEIHSTQSLPPGNADLPIGVVTSQIHSEVRISTLVGTHTVASTLFAIGISQANLSTVTRYTARPSSGAHSNVTRFAPPPFGLGPSLTKFISNPSPEKSA